MAERSNAAVLKTVSPQGLVGSNPTPSASLEIFMIRQDYLVTRRLRDHLLLFLCMDRCEDVVLSE